MSLDDQSGRLSGASQVPTRPASHAMQASVARDEGAEAMLPEPEPTQDNHDMGGEPMLGQTATPTDVAGEQRAASETIAEPSLVTASRRPRFRDRPADWWLRSLRGADSADSSNHGAGDQRLQHGAPMPEEHGHLVGERPELAVAEGALEPEGTSRSADGEADMLAEPAPPRQPVRQATPATGGARATSAMRARRLRGLVAAIIALFLLGIALSRLLGSSASATPAAPTSPVATLPSSTPPAGPFAPVAAAPVAPQAVLGGTARLALPREAVALPNGHIVVADTGNSRVVILDARGRVLQVVRRSAAPFQQPFAVTALTSGFVVLDADRGSLDTFSDSGAFIRELVHSPQLVDARGLAAGPHGQLYVANPRTNSVLVLSREGKVIRTFTGPLSAAPGGFNQPSDVTVGTNGTVYVLDNVNNRIESLTLAGSFIKQWPAPRSDTIFSAHILALTGGRLIVSDPAGALAIYAAGRVQPISVPLVENGRSATPEPIGLAITAHDDIMVTDARGEHLLLIPLAKLSH